MDYVPNRGFFSFRFINFWFITHSRSPSLFHCLSISFGCCRTLSVGCLVVFERHLRRQLDRFEFEVTHSFQCFGQFMNAEPNDDVSIENSDTRSALRVHWSNDISYLTQCRDVNGQAMCNCRNRIRSPCHFF